MKRFFKAKDAALVTPLPPDQAQSYSSRDYLPPSPTPYLSDHEHHRERHRHSAYQPGRGAQPSLPPMVPASSSTSSRSEQRHSLPYQYHHQQASSEAQNANDRARSYQLFDAGPQARVHESSAPFQHREPSGPLYGHQPSMPSPSRKQQRELHNGASLGSQTSGDRSVGAGESTTSSDGRHRRTMSRSIPVSDTSSETDSDEGTAYRQSRALNELVPRNASAAPRLFAAFPAERSENPRPASRTYYDLPGHDQGPRHGPRASASPSMQPQLSGQGSSTSRSSADQLPASWSNPHLASTVMADTTHVTRADVDDQAKFRPLGIRRWKSRMRRGQAGEETDAEQHQDGSDLDGANSSKRNSRRTRHSAVVPVAYPVYAGSAGQDSETLIFPGGEHEKEEGWPKEKEQAKKKLFAFGKDAKAGREPAHERRLLASGAVPTSDWEIRDQTGFDPSALPPISPPAPSKEHHWYDVRGKKKANGKGKEADKDADDIIAAKIGWLCAQQAASEDWDAVLSLAEAVSQSEAASKEATRALRKEFKYGTMDAQKRAARVWAVLAMNSSDRFRLQIVTKRFLEVVEETITSSKTPLSVKETMLRVLGVLAYEFRGDSELSALTKCWNKVKPSDRPAGGEPMSTAMKEFALPRAATEADSPGLPPNPSLPVPSHTFPAQDGLLRQAQSSQEAQPQHPLRERQSRQHLPSTPFEDGFAAAAPARETASLGASAGIQSPQPVRPQASIDAIDVTSMSGSLPRPPIRQALSHDIISLDDDMRKLHEECQIARSNANVLIEMILSNERLRSDSSELVAEFYQKATRSKDFLMSQIPWASAQADQSRFAAIDQQRAAVAAAKGRMPSEDGRQTRQELLLSDLLESHDKCAEAIQMVDDARRQAEEDEEERRNKERNVAEVRVDRKEPVEDAGTGELYLRGDERALRSAQRVAHLTMSAQPSRSRSPSPNPDPSQKVADYSASSRLATSASPMQQQQPRTSRPLPVPRSDHGHSNGRTPLNLGPASHVSASDSMEIGLQYNGGGAGSLTHPREASDASSNFASRNPYATAVAASVPASEGPAASETRMVPTNPFLRQSNERPVGHELPSPPPPPPRLPNPFETGTSPNQLPTLHSRPLAINTSVAFSTRPPPLPPHPVQPHSNAAHGRVSSNTVVDDDDSSSIATPVVPSEKALGKRRAVSDRGEAFDPAIQQEALRRAAEQMKLQE